jgi:hypothetical protein
MIAILPSKREFITKQSFEIYEEAVLRPTLTPCLNVNIGVVQSFSERLPVSPDP